MLSILDTLPRKRGPSRRSPADRIEVALSGGLPTDHSDITEEPVYRQLAELSKIPYSSMMEFWTAYSKRFPDANPQSLKSMKHFAEAVALSTKGRLDKQGGRPTVHTVRNKLRHFMSAWEREHEIIPKQVHDSVCAYIQTHLKTKIPLCSAKKKPTFLTIDNFLHMQTLFWERDYHNYIHEGVRVCLAGLLNLHCYSSARLQELCMARYKDIVCMVAWKSGKPELKLGFTREFAKGMQDTHKKPQHSLYERLDPTPPLFAHGLMFLIPIFIKSQAFRDFKNIEGVLAARPRVGEQYWIMEWDDRVLMDPVFPEIQASGPVDKAKNPNSWGSQCSKWAVRAGFPQGMGLHAARREALIKVDDGGYSLGQVMKFAGHRNASTLVGHYLDDMSNVDGAASFLGLDARRDITEDFRSATMLWNPDLPLSLPTEMLDLLRQEPEYECLTKSIYETKWQIKAANDSMESKTLQIQVDQLYYQRRKLRERLLREHRSCQRRLYNPQSGNSEDQDWRRTYFRDVVRHMVPERARLADSLRLTVPLRSEPGVAALKDLLLLLTNDSTVAYQESLRPVRGKCVSTSCGVAMQSIPIKDRWAHAYRCYKSALEKEYGFAMLCFLCNDWKTGAQDWDSHCQDHLRNSHIPWHCDPVVFRKGLAIPGFCVCCLGVTSISASMRIRSFEDRAAWKRHQLHCLTAYIKQQSQEDLIRCPHPRCDFLCSSGRYLQEHVESDHNRLCHRIGKKRQPWPESHADSDNTDVQVPVNKRRKRNLEAAHDSDGISTVPVAEVLSLSTSHDECSVRHASAGTSSSLRFSTSSDLSASEDSGATLSVNLPASVVSPAVKMFNKSDNVDTPPPNTAGEEVVTIATKQMAQLFLPLPEATWQTDLETESEQEYEVEEVLEKKKYGRQWRYRIKWKGYPVEESTWEPIKNLENCAEKLRDFEQRRRV